MAHNWSRSILVHQIESGLYEREGKSIIEIKKSQLFPGDLVMFQPHSYPRHVGVYVGNNKFIHASTTKGVTMSDLDNPYWKRHYKMSRRVIYPLDQQ